MTKRILALACLLAAMHTPVVRAQSTPTFDVSTVKLHQPGDGNVNIHARPSVFEANNVTVKILLSNAYGIRDFLIFGLPKWAENTRYDIQAKVSEPDLKALQALDRDGRRAMMITLLKERFGIVVHNETKVQPVYELTVDTDGPRLHTTPRPPVVEGEAPKKPSTSWSTHNTEFDAKNATMSALADNLAPQVERFVLDKTGLTGNYDINMRWTADDAKPDNGAPGEAPPNIFTALKEQLGLKLTSGKGPVPTLVVDSIHEPELN